MKMRIAVEFSITDETVRDMLDTAGYGIGYWAASLETLPDKAGTIIVMDRERGDGDPVECRTNFAGIREAFVKLATPGQGYVGSTIYDYFRLAVEDRDEKTGEIDAGHIDSDAADCLVQVALFDDIVYG